MKVKNFLRIRKSSNNVNEMSNREVEELSALGEWLSSFPQLEEIAFDKENTSLVGQGDYQSIPGLKR